MKPTGFVTDGEFNSLRTRGKDRPISIIQLISEARSGARSTRVTIIERSLKLGADGRCIDIKSILLKNQYTRSWLTLAPLNKIYLFVCVYSFIRKY